MTNESGSMKKVNAVKLFTDGGHYMTIKGKSVTKIKNAMERGYIMECDSIITYRDGKTMLIDSHMLLVDFSRVVMAEFYIKEG